MPEHNQTDAPTAPLSGAGTTGDLAAEMEPLAADGPPVAPAPGGWRRVVLGLLVGLAAGALLALVLPRRREMPYIAPGDSLGPGHHDPSAATAASASAAPEPPPGEDHVTDQ